MGNELENFKEEMEKEETLPNNEKEEIQEIQEELESKKQPKEIDEKTDTGGLDVDNSAELDSAEMTLTKGLKSTAEDDIHVENLKKTNPFYLQERRSKAITIALIALISIVVILIVFFTAKRIMDNKKFREEQQKHRQSSSQIDEAPGKVDISDPAGVDPNLEPLEHRQPFDENEIKDNTPRYKGFEYVGYINIPKIGINYPILRKVTNKGLEVSVALEHTDKGINKPGVSVVIGHNYKTKEFFGKNHLLKVGDLIKVKSLDKQEITYKIYDIKTLEDNDKSFINKNTKGKKELVLSTCSDNVTTRLVIFSEELGQTEQ